jgi:hypothetical protein
MRTRIDPAANLLQTVALIFIAGGALYVFHRNRRDESQGGSLQSTRSLELPTQAGR